MAPVVLRARVESHLGGESSGDADPKALARASREALAGVMAHPDGGRAVALDLLAADALITLALLAQARQDPASLEGFAGGLLRESVAP